MYRETALHQVVKMHIKCTQNSKNVNKTPVKSTKILRNEEIHVQSACLYCNYLQGPDISNKSILRLCCTSISYKENRHHTSERGPKQYQERAPAKKPSNSRTQLIRSILGSQTGWRVTLPLARGLPQARLSVKGLPQARLSV